MSGAATTSAAASTAPAAATAQVEAGSLRSGSRLLLLAVGTVVVLVTLPLLRSLALKENERDALRVLELVGPRVFAAETGAVGFGELLQPEGELSRRLPDTRLLADGQLMFHHGYLFEIVPDADGAPGVRAWPLRHGETGLGAFWSLGPGRVLGHPNRAATWSGLGDAPELEPEPEPDAAAEPTGWRALQIGPSGRAGM